jgi:ABC-type multidrug transport system permease subunit
MTTRITTTKETTDLTDAEIDAIVGEAMSVEMARASAEAQPPSSAIVWWRAQMRARREAAELAEKPITIVHALSIAAGLGLMLSVIGYAIAGVKGSTAWLTGLWTSIVATGGSLPVDLSSRWLPVMLTAALVSVVIASIAAYFIYTDGE